MELPPLSTGGVKDTEVLALPAAATTSVGASAVVEGTTLFDAADWALVPLAFVADTRHT
jgi:hypothetical protein